MKDTCLLQTILLPISFFTEKEVVCRDNEGRELFVDTMYVPALNIGVPYISAADDVTGKQIVFIMPDLQRIVPGLNGRRRRLKMRGFRQCLPEAISKQYYTAEMLGIFGVTNYKMMESGVIIRELLRWLCLNHYFSVF